MPDLYRSGSTALESKQQGIPIKDKGAASSSSYATGAAGNYQYRWAQQDSEFELFEFVGFGGLFFNLCTCLILPNFLFSTAAATTEVPALATEQPSLGATRVITPEAASAMIALRITKGAARELAQV